MKFLIKSTINNYPKHYICFLALILMPLSGFAQISHKTLVLDLNNTHELHELIATRIKETYEFSGLATYLNQVQYYLINQDTIEDIDLTQSIHLGENQWFAISGRFDVLLIKAAGATISIDEESRKVSISNANINSESIIISKPKLKQFATELNQIRYNHLWKPFAIVAKLSESLLVYIKSLTSLSWGMVILLFAVVIKLILLPVSIITAKSQKKVSQITSQLHPKLKSIKSKYDGEQAHNKIMQAHKDLGVTPFYTLKPMLSFLIQIPILIAVFNALAEMPQLVAQPFLWFDDLSKPDMWFSLGFNMPLLGSYVNLMPIVMTILALATTILHQDRHASASENKNQKIKLYLMAFSFLILFYPFPAAMVMYWAMANLLGFIQQKIVGK